MSEIVHGTPAGATRHYRRGEAPCEACRAARSEYDRARRAADPAVARRARARSTAQRLACSELSRRHPEEYRGLYLGFVEALTYGAEERENRVDN